MTHDTTVPKRRRGVAGCKDEKSDRSWRTYLRDERARQLRADFALELREAGLA